MKSFSPTPWSYTLLHAFETCPYQCYMERVKRAYPFRETDAMTYGNEMHKAAELYVKDNTPLPGKFTFLTSSLNVLKNTPGKKLTEHKLGVTADYSPCSFWDKDVWWRGVSDLTILDGAQAKSIDYKSGGNAKYADMGQLELMSLGVFAAVPEVEVIKAALFYPVAKAFIKDQFVRGDVPRLWEKWTAKHAKVEAAFKSDTWNKKPNGLCKRHCQVLECPHNGRNQ